MVLPVTILDAIIQSLNPAGEYNRNDQARKLWGDTFPIIAPASFPTATREFSRPRWPANNLF